MSMIAVPVEQENDENTAWVDIGPKILAGQLTEATAAAFCGLTQSGQLQSVALRLDWDGYVAVAQFNLADILNAADALIAEFGDPR